MRINRIDITNYKAFYGTETISVGGKNLFIYGENGSGKSSLFYALKDFFQSSGEDVDLHQLENIFIEEDKRGTCAVKVTFSPITPEGGLRTEKDKKYELTTESKTTTATPIREANKLKGFLTYKSLLDIHHLRKDQRIDLFDLLVKGVLKHFKFTLTKGKELGQMWQEVEDAISRKTDRSFPISQKKKEVNSALKAFNDAFGELFKPGGTEDILKHAHPILDRFNQNIDLKLFYLPARPDTDYNKILDHHVHVELGYAGRKVEKPHMFLNEARLSAIAISIYLGMIKRHIQGMIYKILFLDDIFIGLDMSNRLPLLKILETEFPDYQLFITTYDKPWFEFACSHLNDKEWRNMEFYAVETPEGFEIPLLMSGKDLLVKAEKHYKQCDYKAAAVYARSALEKELQKYCAKRGKKVRFREKKKQYKSDDFWQVVKEDLDDSSTICKKIEQYRELVLNPFSHYNTEKHEIKTELHEAIEAVKGLKDELKKIIEAKKESKKESTEKT